MKIELLKKIKTEVPVMVSQNKSKIFFSLKNDERKCDIFQCNTNDFLSTTSNNLRSKKITNYKNYSKCTGLMNSSYDSRFGLFGIFWQQIEGKTYSPSIFSQNQLQPMGFIVNDIIQHNVKEVLGLKLSDPIFFSSPHFDIFNQDYFWYVRGDKEIESSTGKKDAIYYLCKAKILDREKISQGTIIVEPHSVVKSKGLNFGRVAQANLSTYGEVTLVCGRTEFLRNKYGVAPYSIFCLSGSADFTARPSLVHFDAFDVSDDDCVAYPSFIKWKGQEFLVVNRSHSLEIYIIN